MIFALLDVANISTLKYVKKNFLMMKNGLEKKEIIDTSGKAVRFRNIDCITL